MDDDSELRARMRARATTMLGLSTGLIYIIMGSDGLRSMSETSSSSDMRFTAATSIFFGLGISTATVLYRNHKATAYVVGVFLGLAGILLTGVSPDLESSPQSPPISASLVRAA